jgi:glycosyltransferase involved in cell wall biosynthesis
MSSSRRSLETRRGAGSSVDVIIPCYNYGHYLRDCIDSVLTQAEVDVRILVIDDCSTDDSAAVAAGHVAQDKRVSLICHEQNRGHIATYNEGLDWARRDYVVLLSADDLLAPGALHRATTIMDAQPSVGMVYGHAPYFEANDALPMQRQRQQQRRHRVDTWAGSSWITDRCRGGVNVISSPEVVCRTSIQHEVGGYEATLPHVGDLEMWLRIASRSDIAYVRGTAQAYYRVHAASMQRTTFSAHLDDLQQRRDGFDFFFAHAGARLDHALELHELSSRALAREALWRACRAYDLDAVDDVPVDELVEFARSVHRNVESIPEFSGLQRRQRLGPVICHRTQLFVASGIQHRLQSEYRQLRWKHRGR